MAGRLVGIVNAKHSQSGIEGLGFAIPIDLIYDDLLEIIEDGYIHGRVTICIEAMYFDRMNALYYFGSRSEGVYIISTDNDVLKVGDRIIKIGDNDIASESAYVSAVTSLEIGSDVTITVVRGSTQAVVTVSVREYIPEGITVKT
jgi:serine protease Do